MAVFFSVLTMSLFPAPQALAAPEFIKPVACALGQDCWIANYMDVDGNENSAADFKCGPRSYDTHKGVDFAIRDLVTMETGVDVLAAADGKVLRFRDGVADKILSREELDAIKSENRGCGNGVFIDHGDGWNTIYCHMKKDSLTVKEGQTIKAGDILGQVGHSGAAEFPHLHFGVFFENTPVDPFTGRDDSEGCGHSVAGSLWQEAAIKDYQPLIIYASGFTGHAPDFQAIKIDASSPDTIKTDSHALVFWAGMFGVKEGDRIDIEVTDPLGRIFATRSLEQDKTRARQFYYVGRRTNVQPLIPGRYKGTIEIRRTSGNGAVTIDKHEKFIDVE